MSRRTILRRRIVAALVVCVLLAAGLSVALGDGTEQVNRFDASDLGVRPLAGQRLIAGFSGEQPPRALRRMIRNGELAGVILFSDNFDDAGEARRLIGGLQSVRRGRGLRDPLLVMVDQEGGLVKRLPGPPAVSAAEMGSRGETFSRRQGPSHRAQPRQGRVQRRPGAGPRRRPPRRGDQRGGAKLRLQRRHGLAERRCLRRGLAGKWGPATAKHFPGLGAAELNTDFGVVEIGLSAATIRSVDEAPFAGFIDSGGALVMMSNAIYPAFSQRPAVFTRAIATGELRDRLGFEGVSVTDALQAAAAEAFGGPAKVGVAAARAGTDLLLFRQYKAADRAGAALRRALRARSLPRAQFERSAQRVLDLRAELSG